MTKPRFLTWKFEVAISVEAKWIADGYSGNTNQLAKLIREHLLNGHNTPDQVEVKVKTLEAPPEKTVQRIQGYIID